MLTPWARIPLTLIRASFYTIAASLIWLLAYTLGSLVHNVLPR